MSGYQQREYTNKALRSFFGAREGGQDRPQDVNTPLYLIDAILDVWDDGIELDPFAGLDSIVPAKNKVFGDSPTNGGYGIIWPHYTYANPPYKHPYLVNALKKAETGSEHMLLVPVRTLRQWWCDEVARSSLVAWLAPVTFHGHKQSFPTPLAMVYYGGYTKLFRRAFEPYARRINEFK